MNLVDRVTQLEKRMDALELQLQAQPKVISLPVKIDENELNEIIQKCLANYGVETIRAINEIQISSSALLKL
jgi:hypothetical protein